MDSTTSFSDFDDFFPHYCSEHARPLTRWMHFAGTHLGGAVLLAAAARREPRLLPAAPVAAYGIAWLAHATVERNRPATFRHPWWSLRGDVRMIGLMWSGRDAAVQALADGAQERRQRPIVLPGAPRISAA